MKTFNLGFVFGRFQHVHKSHQKIIEISLQSCEKVILMVGSSQEVGTERNPFNLYTRMNLIRKVFAKELMSGRLLLAHIDDMTHENDHSKEWGEFLLNKIDMWRGHYGVHQEVDCFIYGNDEERSSWFTPKSIEKINHIMISRKNDNVSATGLRKLLVDDCEVAWKSNVPVAIHSSYKLLREELLNVPYYKNALILGGK